MKQLFCHKCNGEITKDLIIAAKGPFWWIHPYHKECFEKKKYLVIINKAFPVLFDYRQLGNTAERGEMPETVAPFPALGCQNRSCIHCNTQTNNHAATKHFSRQPQRGYRLMRLVIHYHFSTQTIFPGMLII